VSGWQLWWLYGRNEGRACAQINAIGSRTRRRRVNADYHLNHGDLEAAAKDVIADAELCLSLLESLAPELPKDLPCIYRR
jgi:hypothetical protein